MLTRRLCFREAEPGKAIVFRSVSGWRVRWTSPSGVTGSKRYATHAIALEAATLRARSFRAQPWGRAS